MYEFLFYLFTACGCFCDALRDVYYWANYYKIVLDIDDLPELNIVNKGNWHSFKYSEIVCFLAAGYCLGNYNYFQSLLMIICSLPMALEVWEGTYNYALCGKFFNIKKEEFHIPYFEKRIVVGNRNILILIHIMLCFIFMFLLAVIHIFR